MSMLSEVKVHTAPSVEPITLTEAKNYMKVDYTNDDTLIEDVLIPSAREMVEKMINKALITQTLKAYYSSFDNIVDLPYAPVQSVTSVKRIQQNTTTTLTVDSDYYVQGLDDKFLLITSPYSSPPGFSPSDSFNGAELLVEYVAGYGTAGSNVPAAIKEAIRKIVAFNYENRNEDEAGLEIPNSAKNILNKYRSWQI
tara:strand:- start:698 stop:1288 length:591 start_codon:yes stop_codon:yes gene_type:complete